MRLIIAASLAFSCQPALAQTPSDRNEVCESISEIALKVMASRQAGEAAPDVLRSLDQGDSQDISPIFTDLVVAAYNEPRFNTDENKANAVGDFGNGAWAECMNAK